MKLLLDTCSFIWLTSAPDRLGAKARDALDADQAEILLSDVSIWEICTKWLARKLDLPSPPRVWIEEQASLWQLDRLPINPKACYRSTELPDLHRDPFDRMLGSQALDDGLTIVTPDDWIHKYPVAVLW